MIEVLHEDGSRLGEEEWEEHLAASLGNGTSWIQLNGWATTINWGRILRPSFAAALRHRLAAAPHAPRFKGVVANGPPHDCLSCAIWAMYHGGRFDSVARRGGLLGEVGLLTFGRFP